MTQKRRNEITGLRGLSACAIAYIFHYTELFHTMPERFPIQAAVMGFLARYGVCMSEIFFMLSGMLLYWSYQKRLSEGELRLGNFICFGDLAFAESRLCYLWCLYSASGWSRGAKFPQGTHGIAAGFADRMDF